MHHATQGLYFHIVITTRGRAPMITPRALPFLQEGIAEVIFALDSSVIAANGMEDHYHLLVHVGPRIGLSRFVDMVKSSTEQWVNSSRGDEPPLEWQEGYSAFIVCAQDADTAAANIWNQEMLHRRISYQEELLQLRRASTLDALPARRR